MHMRQTRVVHDALGLAHGQHVLMPSGQAARVAEIKLHSIVFEYLGLRQRELVELSREHVRQGVRF